jgi:hypothetical protein
MRLFCGAERSGPKDCYDENSGRQNGNHSSQFEVPRKLRLGVERAADMVRSEDIRHQDMPEWTWVGYKLIRLRAPLPGFAPFEYPNGMQQVFDAPYGKSSASRCSAA